MNYDRLDYDAEAARLGKLLSTVQAYIVAARVHQTEYDLNFTEAMENAVSIRANAELILRYIDPREYNNHNRFKSMLDTATKLSRDFWKLFKLETVVADSGKALTVSASQMERADNLQESKPRKLVSVNGGKRTNFNISRMSDEKKIEIIDDIEKRFGGHLTMAEIRQVADEYGQGFSTISNLYYTNFKKKR